MADQSPHQRASTPHHTDGSSAHIGFGLALWLMSFVLVLAASLYILWHDVRLDSHIFFPLPDERAPLFHVVCFFQMWIGKAIPFFRGLHYWNYAGFIADLVDSGKIGRLGWRWLIATMIAFYVSTTLARWSWQPVQTTYQTRGRVLVEGDEAYKQLKADWKNQNDQAAPAFILETDEGYQPSSPETYRDLEPHQKLMMPNAMRVSHFLFAAGTRRGKTQLILKRIWEFLTRILDGEAIKVLIVDTPKGDYSRYIPIEHMVMIAPQDENGRPWDIGRDLENKHAVEEFWRGKFPDDHTKGDPFWTEAPRSLGAASMVILTQTCGNDWSLNNAVRILKLPVAEQEPLIRTYYPEAIQMIQMGDKTLSSVLGTLEARTKDLLQLAEIWDGYQYKHDIQQLSVRLLQDQYEDNINLLAQTLLPLFDHAHMENGAPAIIAANIIPNFLFCGLIRSCNKKLGNTVNQRWKWSDLVDILNKPFKDIVVFAMQGMNDGEKKEFIAPHIWQELADALRTLGNATRSFGDDEEMVNYVASMQLSRTTAYLLRALIRHSAYAPQWSSMSAMAQTSLNEPIELLNITIANLSSKELCGLVNENNWLTLVTAMAPIFQWYKTWDQFEAKDRFSMREWIDDENPHKKFLVLKTSGQYSALTTPLLRGMLFFAKGLIDDDAFLDDKDAGFVRQFYILMDEFQALGNVREFITSALERFASKGVTVMLAVQDLAGQLTPIYSQEFVDFLLSNTGNVFFIGSNMGKTAEMISNAIGKKWFNKLHRSVSYSDGGKSTSYNWQEHEAYVMTPDEVNSKLGQDINGMQRRSFVQWLMNTSPDNLPIRYLYLPANMTKAYLLSTPTCHYPVVTRPIPAVWRDKTKNPVAETSPVGALLATGQPDNDYANAVAVPNRWTNVSVADITAIDGLSVCMEGWQSTLDESAYQCGLESIFEDINSPVGQLPFWEDDSVTPKGANASPILADDAGQALPESAPSGQSERQLFQAAMARSREKMDDHE